MMTVFDGFWLSIGAELGRLALGLAILGVIGLVLLAGMWMEKRK